MQKRTINESISIDSNKSRTLIKNESTFTDNIGNYAITNCFGSIENTLENMYFACDNKDQNRDTYISMGKRKKGSTLDRTIGQTDIMDGTGFWKNLIGFTCTYAIEYVDDVLFVPGKCKSSIN